MSVWSTFRVLLSRPVFLYKEKEMGMSYSILCLWNHAISYLFNTTTHQTLSPPPFNSRSYLTTHTSLISDSVCQKFGSLLFVCSCFFGFSYCYCFFVLFFWGGLGVGCCCFLRLLWIVLFDFLPFHHSCYFSVLLYLYKYILFLLIRLFVFSFSFLSSLCIC